jgi:uncharacterized membrane protein
MARDISDVLTKAVSDAVKNMGDIAPSKNGSGPLSGAKGIAAGMGLAAAAPFVAKKGIDAVRGNGKLSAPKPAKLATKAASTAGDRVGSKVKDAVSSKIDEAGGAAGVAKEAAGGLLPGKGGDSGGKGGQPGVGKGRRMPVQQAVDVAVPIETAYNQWTQFEEWPNFMHRVTRVTQEDDCTVSFATKIWGKTKEFEAKIETQRPDERIKWSVSQGITHAGVVTFHELAPRLTRIELDLDVEPGSLIEKAARGMRHVKRAVRADLHRYKAFIEMQELESGAWRGVIEDGELVKEHAESYDQQRRYHGEDDGGGSQPTQGSKRSGTAASSRSRSSRSTSSRGSSESSGSGGGRSSSSSRKRGSSSTKSSSSSRSRGGSNSKASSSNRRRASSRS